MALYSSQLQVDSLSPRVPIEDFDTLPHSAFDRFCRKVASRDSLVRIAFLGDSFVEADIITADLRELFQTKYGGSGVGYAPMATPLTRYRPTIKTAWEGWTSHNIMQYNRTAEPMRSHFPISGWVSLPTNGVSITWSATSARKYIDSCQVARLHFVAFNSCRLEVSVNELPPQSYSFEGGEQLRQIVVRDTAIRTLKLKVVSGAAGFMGYGAIFEGDSGVVVDNYSVRSNNGRAILWSSPTINSQIDAAIGGYDLVVLQYGLNIMQSGVTHYTNYGAQLERMIEFVRESFPSAAIVVMGVSDRWIKQGGEYRQMLSESTSLTAYQREASINQGVCFWNTCAAMASQGGMENFVKHSLAAKDHTHINVKGGAVVAKMLFEAIDTQVDNQRRYIIRMVDHAPILDEAHRDKICEDLRKSTKLQYN